MKAIQSFRSEDIRPALESFGGPALLKTRIQVMALSAASIAQHYDSFEFITDDAGAAMAEACALPYTKITSIGPAFNSSKRFWVHSKFEAYKSKEPFLHFDNDLFLWEPLPSRVHQADVVSLHGESFGWPIYESWLQSADKIKGMPRLQDKYYYNRTPMNMAIFGGNDTVAISRYAEYVLAFVDSLNGLRDLDAVEAEAIKPLMPVFEQLWGSYLLQCEYGKRPEFILTEREIHQQLDNPEVKLTHMQDAKLKLAQDPKKLMETIQKIEHKLKTINPKVYAAVAEFTSTPLENPFEEPEHVTLIT